MYLVVTMAALLLLVGQGCAAGPAPAPRDYYFSPSGDDRRGSGTAERPYQTLAKAGRIQFKPGDRLLLEGGQTFRGPLSLDAQDAGTSVQPVTICSYGPAGRAAIDAGRDTGIRVENAGGIRVADLLIVGAGLRANHGSGVEFVNTLPDAVKLKSVRIENVQVKGFGREGIVVRGAARDGSSSGYSDVRIVDCVVRENTRTGIYVAGPYEGDAEDLARRFSHEDVRIIRCLAAENPGDPRSRNENRSGSGILLDSVAGGTIEYCEASVNGAENRARDGGPVGIWSTSSDHVTIQFCKSHHNRTGGTHDGGGFCLDGGVCNSVLQYNLSEENDGSGYGLYEYPFAPPAKGNIVRNNISRNDGRRNGYAGIHVWDDAGALRDVRICDNTVEMDAAPQSTRPPRGIWIQSPIRNATFVGNTIRIGPGVRLMDVSWGQLNVRFERNNYRTESDDIALEWEGRSFGSLRQWMERTGQELTPDGEREADAK